MYRILVHYLIGLLIGVPLGLAYPFLASWWLFLCLLIVIVAHELVGGWGFGAHWREYRYYQHILYTGFALFLIVGILLGSGAVGTALVTLGKLIS
jgi:hypothetical protein